MAESDIHSIVRNYPYLISERLAAMRVNHEHVYSDGTRSDFIFEDGTLSVVVEVKKGPIDKKMILQLDNYVKNEHERNPEKPVSGILIGRSTVNVDVLKLASDRRYTVKFLDVDVPTKIRLCAKGTCRRATSYTNERCPYCGSRKFVRDPFLL